MMKIPLWRLVMELSKLSSFKTEIVTPSWDNKLWQSTNSSTYQMSEFNGDWRSEGKIQWGHQGSDQTTFWWAVTYKAGPVTSGTLKGQGGWGGSCELFCCRLWSHGGDERQIHQENLIGTLTSAFPSELSSVCSFNLRQNQEKSDCLKEC